jgi:hypothetical protein
MHTKPSDRTAAGTQHGRLAQCTHSVIAQAMAPAAAEKCVTAKALLVKPSDNNSLPALKPNHPTHSIAAPSAV